MSHGDVVIDARPDPLSAQTLLEATRKALGMFGDIEARLDKQIYPEQVGESFDAPDDREYAVTLTAKEWRLYGAAMLALEDAVKRGERADGW